MELGVIWFKYTEGEIYKTEPVTEYDSLWDEFPGITKGIGKLKDYKVHLYIDESVPPVEQGIRTLVEIPGYTGIGYLLKIK